MKAARRTLRSWRLDPDGPRAPAPEPDLGLNPLCNLPLLLVFLAALSIATVVFVEIAAVYVETRW
jgi:hypothetical protein